MTYDILRIIKKTNEYRERASRYLQNFEWEMERGDREKAGEALWGVVSCLINALYLLENGKPSTKHRDSGEFARQFMISKFGERDGKELLDIYGKVEKFHANFYHAFLDEEEFKKIATEIMRLIKCIDSALGDKLSEVEIKITA
jgi:HEPN domain-containing protein